MPKCKRVSQVNDDYRGANIRKGRIKDNSPVKCFVFVFCFLCNCIFLAKFSLFGNHYSPSMFIFSLKKMFLMLIIRAQIFECKYIPCSHTDTLWHQTNCHSIFEKSGGKKGSSASHWLGNSADACVTDSSSSLVAFLSSECFEHLLQRSCFGSPLLK